MGAENAFGSKMSEQQPQHTESHTRAGIAPGWYIVAASKDVGAKPKPFVLNGLPIVTFRDSSGQSVSLLDRCAHRNAPLSAGRVIGGTSNATTTDGNSMAPVLAKPCLVCAASRTTPRAEFRRSLAATRRVGCGSTPNPMSIRSRSPMRSRARISLDTSRSGSGSKCPAHSMRSRRTRWTFRTPRSCTRVFSARTPIASRSKWSFERSTAASKRNSSARSGRRAWLAAF